MVEITSEEQNRVKRMKRTEDSFSDHWDNIKPIKVWIIGFPEEDKKKAYEKIFEEIIVKNFSNKRNSQWSPRGAKSAAKDKPKEKHAKTRTNQINKD